MLQLSPATRVFAALEPTDMRNGMDGLAAACRRLLSEDPMTGAVFAFINKARTHIRLLTYDGQGFILLTKRLSAGRFRHWPKANAEKGKKLTATQLIILLRGGDPAKTTEIGDWRPLLP